MKTTLLTAALLAAGPGVFAQLSGSYTIPGSYTTIAAAITDLNTAGVSGPVTLNIAAGYTETAPAGGLRLGSTTLNAALSATNTLTFVKSGTGTNPLITASAGTSATADVIFALSGTDYVTIDGIDLRQNSIHTSIGNSSEVGYGLYNLNATAPFDGCNNNLIQNCTVSLRRATLTPSRAIQVAHYTVGTTTNLSITATGDLHSNNKFYTNKLTNALGGIYLIGYAAPSPYTLYDQNNDIGGTSAATGNVITNFLGAVASNVYGIYAINQNNLNASYNTLDQLADGGVSSSGLVYGIYTGGTNSTFTLSNNTVALSETPANSSTTGVYGIFNTSAGTTITANNNKLTLTEPGGVYSFNYGIYFLNSTNVTVSGCRVTQDNQVGSTTSGVGTTYGIYVRAGGTVNINTDTVTQLATAATGTNAQYYSIVAGGDAVTESIQNNVFLNSNVTSNGATGFVALIYASNATPNKTISGNSVVGTVTHTATTPSSAATYGILYQPIFPASTGLTTFSNNNFSNIISSSCPFYGIYCAAGTSSQTFAVNGNTISNITTTTEPSYGIYFDPGDIGSQNVTIDSNTIAGLSAASGPITGVYTSSGNGTGYPVPGTILTVSRNTVRDLSNTGAGDVQGFYHTGTDRGTTTFSRNKIHDLQSGGATTRGITIAGGGSTNIVNNLVGNLRCLATVNIPTDQVIGINLIATGVNSSQKVYYNTVYLAATYAGSGGDFFTSALFHTASSSTGLLDLRNNILVNNSAASGLGTAAAFRRSGATLDNLAATSNRNLLYAGAPSPAHVLYVAGTAAGAQTISAYRTALSPAEGSSQTENALFVSTAASSDSFLHPVRGTTLIESGAANIPGYTQDFKGRIRQGNPGYTGTGTAPDIGAIEGDFDASIPLSATLLAFSGSTRSGVNTLYWEVADEASTHDFVLERSTDGQRFAPIANLATGGRSYSYTDPQTTAGTRYYRLRLTGFSGKASYSNTVALITTGSSEGSGTITAVPNPATGNTVLHLPAFTGTATVELLDAAGRKVWEARTAASLLALDVSRFTPGRYIIRLHSGNPGGPIAGSLLVN